MPPAERREAAEHAAATAWGDELAFQVGAGIRLVDTRKCFRAALAAYQSTIHESSETLVAENERLRAALRVVMDETGTSTRGHHAARDALDIIRSGGEGS